MPEKITILELDIDLAGSKKDVEDLRLTLNDLKKGLKELTDAEKENNKQIDQQTQKLKELQAAEKQDAKAISETKAGIEKLVIKRNELNRSIVNQSTALKTNQTELRSNEKVIQDAIFSSEKYRKLEENSINTINKKVSALTKYRNSLDLQSKEYKEVTADLNRLIATQKREQESIGRSQLNVGNYGNTLQGVGKQIGAFITKLGAMALAYVGVQTIRESIDAWKEQEQAIVDNIAVFGDFSKTLQDFSSEVQKVTTVGDEQTLALTTQAGNFGIVAEKVEEATIGAIGLAEKFKKAGLSQETALKGIALAYTGNFTQLQRYIPALKEAETEAEKMAILQKEMAAGFDLSMEAAKSQTGQLEQMKNELGDVKEEIGKGIIPALLKMYKVLLQSIKGWQSFFNAVSQLKTYGKVINENDEKFVKANVEKFKTEAQYLSELQKERKLKGKLLFLEEQILNSKKDIDGADKETQKTLNARIKSYEREKQLFIELGQTDFFKGKKTAPDYVAPEIILSDEDIEEEKQRLKQLADQRAKAAEEIKKQQIEREKEAADITKQIQDDIISNLEQNLEQKKLLNQDELADYSEILQTKYDFGLLKEEEYQTEVLRLSVEAQAKINELNLANIEAEKQRKITDEQNKLVLAEGNIFAQLEVERAGLEAKRLQEIEFAEKIGADVTLIEEKYTKAKIELNRAETEAKLSLAGDFFSNIATIAGEGTAAGKAAAVAATTISTYQAAMGAFASLSSIPVVGTILGAVAAAAAVAAGVLNVKKILAVKTGLPGDSGGGGGSAPSVGGGVAKPSIIKPGSIAPEINKGIIARSIPAESQTGDQWKTAVIVDEVTSKQNQKTSNTNTSII